MRRPRLKTRLGRPGARARASRYRLFGLLEVPGEVLGQRRGRRGPGRAPGLRSCGLVNAADGFAGCRECIAGDRPGRVLCRLGDRARPLRPCGPTTSPAARARVPMRAVRRAGRIPGDVDRDKRRNPRCTPSSEAVLDRFREARAQPPETYKHWPGRARAPDLLRGRGAAAAPVQPAAAAELGRAGIPRADDPARPGLLLQDRPDQADRLHGQARPRRLSRAGRLGRARGAGHPRPGDQRVPVRPRRRLPARVLELRRVLLPARQRGVPGPLRFRRRARHPHLGREALAALRAPGSRAGSTRTT